MWPFPYPPMLRSAFGQGGQSQPDFVKKSREKGLSHSVASAKAKLHEKTARGFVMFALFSNLSIPTPTSKVTKGHRHFSQADHFQRTTHWLPPWHHPVLATFAWLGGPHSAWACLSVCLSVPSLLAASPKPALWVTYASPLPPSSQLRVCVCMLPFSRPSRSLSCQKPKSKRKVSC